MNLPTQTGRGCENYDESIVHLVRAIAAGATSFSRTVIAQLLTASDAASWPALATLTATELELAALLAEGLPNAQIAAELHWTLQSVRNGASRLCRKLGITRLQLIARFPRSLKKNRN